MNKERLNPREAESIPIGESRKSVILIEKSKKEGYLVTPNGVGVWQEVEKKDDGGYERKRIEPVEGEVGLFRLSPGRFTVRDLELKEKNEVPVKFPSNSDNLKQVA